MLTSTFVQDKVVQEARKYNINIVHVDSKTVEEVYDSIKVIGELAYRQREAQQLVERMKRDFAEIQQKFLPGRKPQEHVEERELG